MENQNSLKLVQSASALGAAILGFGLGAKWGYVVAGYALVVILLGSIIHISGMYVLQLKDANKSDAVGKALWISAWVCLLALVVITIYLLIRN